MEPPRKRPQAGPLSDPQRERPHLHSTAPNQALTPSTVAFDQDLKSARAKSVRPKSCPPFERGRLDESATASPLPPQKSDIR